MHCTPESIKDFQFDALCHNFMLSKLIIFTSYEKDHLLSLNNWTQLITEQGWQTL